MNGNNSTDDGQIHKKCVYYKWLCKVFGMKRRELIKKLEKAGFRLKRHGDHDTYERGSDQERIPRHREINERLAQAILKKWGLK